MGIIARVWRMMAYDHTSIRDPSQNHLSTVVIVFHLLPFLLPRILVPSGLIDSVAISFHLHFAITSGLFDSVDISFHAFLCHQACMTLLFHAFCYHLRRVRDCCYLFPCICILLSSGVFDTVVIAFAFAFSFCCLEACSTPPVKRITIVCVLCPTLRLTSSSSASASSRLIPLKTSEKNGSRKSGITTPGQEDHMRISLLALYRGKVTIRISKLSTGLLLC